MNELGSFAYVINEIYAESYYTYGRELVFLRIYIVQKGDTLYKIAKRHHVQLDEVIKLNSHISNPDYIVPGMKIKLPNHSVKEESAKKEKKEWKEKERGEARSAERPLGSVSDMNGRGMGDRTGRVPLRHHTYHPHHTMHHGRGHERNHDREMHERHGMHERGVHDKHHEKHAHQDGKRPTGMKSYSDKQYRSHEQQRPQQQFYRPNYPHVHEQHRGAPHMNNHMPMGSLFDQPQQLHYCPCCMYHWQMQQYWRNQYYDHEPYKKNK